jgi:fimbrial chaperone protein
MRRSIPTFLVTVFAATLCSSALAASLLVSPVSVEATAPAAAATLTLRNESDAPLNAQIRVFRWTEVDGEEKLEATDELVASPPTTTLAPKVDYAVRFVRVAQRPVSSGESYRVLVDEIPSAKAHAGKGVALVMRYSIPVFFYLPTASDGKLTWSVEQRDGRTFVSATNTGDRHVRVAALKLKGGNKTEISFGDGLAGYVLGHATRVWAVPREVGRLSGPNSLVIEAQTNYGPIRVPPTSPPGR